MEEKAESLEKPSYPRGVMRTTNPNMTIDGILVRAKVILIKLDKQTAWSHETHRAGRLKLQHKRANYKMINNR